jgi:hypothetical protein
MSLSRRRRVTLAAVSTSVAIGGAGLLAAAPTHAAGTPVKVVTVGSDAELAAALSSANLLADEQIQLKPGSYATAVTITKNGVILKGTGAGVVFSSTVTLAGSYGIVDGITVTNPAGAGIYVKGGSGNTVQNSITTGNANSGIIVAGTTTDATRILHNRSYGNGTGVRSANGIEVRAPHTVVAGNVTSDNQDSGIEFYDVGYATPAPNGANYGVAVNNVSAHNGDHGIDNLAVNHGIVAGNTVVDNCTSGINVEGGQNVSASSTPHQNPGGDYQITGNIAVDNATNTACAHGPQGADKKGQPGQIRIADDQVNNVQAFDNLAYITPGLAPAINNGSALYVWSPVDPTTHAPQISGFTSAAALLAATGLGQGDVNADPGLDPVTLRPTASAPLAHHGFIPSGTPYADVDADWSGRSGGQPSLGAFEVGGTPGTVPGQPVLPDTGTPVTPPTTPPTTPTTPTTTPTTTPPTTQPTTPPTAQGTLFQIGGADRYDTGVQVSRHRWPAQQADAVVLATGNGFADALAGVPLAAQANGPLLLADGSQATLRADVLAELNRVLKPGGTVYILGGTAAMNGGLEGFLAAHGAPKVVRFQGADRYETSVKIARDGLGSPANVVVATGNGFADALAAGPLATGPAAAAPGRPAAIVLTDDQAVPASVAGYLAGKNGSAITAVGKQAADAVPSAASKLWGRDRFETDKAVVDRFTGAAAGTHVGIADGTNFPDALTGGAYMASLPTPGPIVLVDGTAHIVPGIAAAILAGRAGINEGDIFGGPAVITPAMRDAVAQDLNAKFDAVIKPQF